MKKIPRRLWNAMRIHEHNQKRRARLAGGAVDVPVPPAQIASITAGMTNSVNLTKAGNLVYVASAGARRLNIVDVTNPSSPVLAGSFSDTTNLNSVEAVRVHGNYAFCVTENQAR
jgi:hypothetical protein